MPFATTAKQQGVFIPPLILFSVSRLFFFLACICFLFFCKNNNNNNINNSGRIIKNRWIRNSKIKIGTKNTSVWHKTPYPIINSVQIFAHGAILHGYDCWFSTFSSFMNLQIIFTFSPNYSAFCFKSASKTAKQLNGQVKKHSFRFHFTFRNYFILFIRQNNWMNNSHAFSIIYVRRSALNHKSNIRKWKMTSQTGTAKKKQKEKEEERERGRERGRGGEISQSSIFTIFQRKRINAKRTVWHGRYFW